MDSRDRAVILLVGLPQINNTLRLSTHEPLRQRIIMNYNIEGLSKEEGREYIGVKLKGAGCHQDIYDNGAIEAILNGADGTARIISKLCNAALVIGNSQEISVINADTVMQAINDCCAIPTLCFMPPENVPIFLSATASRPTSSRSSSVFLLAWLLLNPFSADIYIINLRAVNSG